jgi:hypothetical protein
MTPDRPPITPADGSCAPTAAPDAAPATRTFGPCDCLPRSPKGWPACAHCGLPQAPGKEFCGFCGHRWVSTEDARPPGDLAPGDHPASQG